MSGEAAVEYDLRDYLLNRVRCLKSLDMIREYIWKDYGLHWRWMILYVYIPLLESELEDLKLAYNAHKIRTQKGKLRPDGIPDDMYYFQERFGGEEEVFVPSEDDLQQIAIQHGLGRPLPSYIPDEVRTLADDWCRSHDVTVRIGNALLSTSV